MAHLEIPSVTCVNYDWHGSGRWPGYKCPFSGSAPSIAPACLHAVPFPYTACSRQTTLKHIFSHHLCSKSLRCIKSKMYSLACLSGSSIIPTQEILIVHCSLPWTLHSSLPVFFLYRPSFRSSHKSLALSLSGTLFTPFATHSLCFALSSKSCLMCQSILKSIFTQNLNFFFFDSFLIF